MKIAVFGSAFNPPTFGHKSVLERLSHFDLVLMVPSIAHAWGKEMLPYPIRCELVQLFIDDIALQNVQLCDVETHLYEPEAQASVTTYAVLEQLQKDYPESDLTFVMGPDNFLQFSKFYKANEITQKWSVLACPETIGVRSTQIRQNCNVGHPITELTTPRVIHYINTHQLYQ